MSTEATTALNPGTISDLVDEAIRRGGEKVWLFHLDETYTYDDLGEQIERRLGALVGLGVAPGERVVVCMPNVPEQIFLWLAVLRLGGIAIAVNPAASVDEMRSVIERTRPSLAVASADGLEVMRRAVSGSAVTLVCESHVRSARSHRFTASPVGADDVATFIATSGTTAQPKFVMQSHRTYVLTAEAFPSWLGLTSDDVLMATMPLFHLNAQVYSVLGSLAAGASLALCGRFSARRFWGDVHAYGCTQLNAMGAMVEILMRQPVSDLERENPLRLVYSAPAPNRDRHLEIEERFGLKLMSGYGLSESPYGLIWPIDGPRPFGALGWPRQHPFRSGTHNDAKILDEAGQEAHAGEFGELALRNAAIMNGYFDDPAASAAVLQEGWLLTGDLVRKEVDGCFYFVARKKDIIRRRGENIAPAEVEAVLEEHIAISEAGVVAVPSELSEDEVKAFIVVHEGAAVSARDVNDWCRERLATFKVPRYLEFVDSLPHTPTGRVAKHLLPRERSGREIDLVARETSAHEAQP